jgi:lipopolysaccharide export system protein LptA
MTVKRLLLCLILATFGDSLPAAKPSTTVTSDRMEMLRFEDRNEFLFVGNVQLKSRDFSGSCDRMWVCTRSEQQTKNDFSDRLWCFVRRFSEQIHRPFCCLYPVDENESTPSQMGQLKLIIAKGDVFLRADDKETGEVKQATAQKAVIYPNEGKMVLTESPVVKCSVQGTFKGEKITFFQNSGQVLVENSNQGRRAQVQLGEDE